MSASIGYENALKYLIKEKFFNKMFFVFRGRFLTN